MIVYRIPRTRFSHTQSLFIIFFENISQFLQKCNQPPPPLEKNKKYITSEHCHTKSKGTSQSSPLERGNHTSQTTHLQIKKQPPQRNWEHRTIKYPPIQKKPFMGKFKPPQKRNNKIFSIFGNLMQSFLF